MWIVEYSPSQKAFHIQEFDKALSLNMELFKTGIIQNHEKGIPDYIMLSVHQTSLEAMKEIWMLRKMMKPEDEENGL